VVSGIMVNIYTVGFNFLMRTNIVRIGVNNIRNISIHTHTLFGKNRIRC
jgi:hypothetical protein